MPLPVDCLALESDPPAETPPDDLTPGARWLIAVYVVLSVLLPVAVRLSG